MTEKKLSTLGYLMDRLGLSIAELARRLHVDVSLANKWRSGSRRFSVKSIYFEEICTMFLKRDDTALDDTLHPPVLLKNSEGSPGTAMLLRRVPTDRYFTVPRTSTLRTEAMCTAEIAVHISGEERWQAISDLLDVAKAIEMPGEMLYVDSEQSGQLLEDPVYAREWIGQMLGLLDRGFIFRVALHFSVPVGGSVSFSHLRDPLIFHRNVYQFYYRCYDENIYWFSFFILEHAMSVPRMSMSTEQISTTVYTDAYSILQHRNVFHMVLTSRRSMFVDLSTDTGREAAGRLNSPVRQGEKLLSYLPASAFMTVEETLLNDILQENEVTGQATSRCRGIDRLLRAVAEWHLAAGEEVTQILQLDGIQRRIRTRYISTNLSLIYKKQVVISLIHCARKLEELAGRMEWYPFCCLFLTDGTGHICLSDTNYWRHGTSWMVQMGAHGFRVCRKPTLSDTTYITLERGWRRVPPGHRDPAAVLFVLRSLIMYIKDCIL